MDLRERLRNTDDVLVMFFSMQTLLVEEYGKPMETHLGEWILAHPKEFQDSLRRLYDAGYDMAHPGTQANSPFRAKPFGVQDKVYELNYQAVKLAKEVTPEGCYVAGLVSTSNPDFLEPVGNMTYDEVYQGYREQVLPMLDAGVDLIAVGGNHVDDAAIAIKMIKNYSDIPVIGSNVFYAGKKGFHMITGHDPKTASAMLQEAGADVVGFNCGLMTKSLDTSEWYPAATALLKEVKQGTDRYLFASPDAGLAQLIKGKTVYPASPEEMASEVLNWVDVEARIVGGCCGTSIEHGRRVSAVLKGHKAKKL